MGRSLVEKVLVVAGVELLVACSGDGGLGSGTKLLEPLASDASWTFEGDQSRDRLGYSVASAGDVNGDGYADAIVGVPHYDGGETEEGRALLFLGAERGLLATPAWSVESNVSNARLGVSVASAGDVNGDGFSDVIIGADHVDAADGHVGRAYVYLGSRRGLGLQPVWIGLSPQAGARFGASVAGAGDVNGDGFADVVVGAPDYDDERIAGGAAFLFLGSCDGLEAQPAWVGSHGTTQELYGTSVAGAGDVNGDGYSDVIVGAPATNGGGRALVYQGSASGLCPSPVWIGSFGYSVAGAGDVNGDGYSDVVVGTPGVGGGVVALHLGSATGLRSQAAWSERASGTIQLGWSVAGAGDVNADGYADIVVGAPTGGNGGKAFVYRGSASGIVPGAAFTRTIDRERARFGAAVAGAGDVNGDGFGDIVIGASHEVDNEEEGRVFAYHGTACSSDNVEDGDADGTPNCADGCVDDPKKTVPGVCGCGYEETDSDSDGVLDCVDRCPTVRAVLADGCPPGGEPGTGGTAGVGGSGGSGVGGGSVGGTSSGGSGSGGSGSGGGEVGGTSSGGSGTAGTTSGGTGSGGSGSGGSGSDGEDVGGTNSGGSGNAGTAGRGEDVDGTNSGGTGSGGAAGSGGEAAGGSAPDPAATGGSVNVEVPEKIVAAGRFDFGCGCRVPAQPASGRAWDLALFALGLVAWRRRRSLAHS